MVTTFMRAVMLDTPNRSIPGRCASALMGSSPITLQLCVNAAADLTMRNALSQVRPMTTARR